MFEFHRDRRRYFDIQVENTKESVFPFLATHFPLAPGSRILEIGCGEGGVLKAFIDKGHTGVGVELDETRVINGKQWMQEEITKGSMHFVTENIYNILPEDLGGKFHLIILKDVIEHLADKDKMLQQMKQYLHPGGAVFFGFPPWQMPFGGHQQLCHNKVLSKMPWFHLLPRPVYKWVLTRCKENVPYLMEIHDAGISIEGFEKLAKRNGYAVLGKKHFLIAPIYKYKFRLKERKQVPVIRHIPWFRNLFTTAVYYTISPYEKGR